MWEIAAYDDAANNFTFGAGGFQGGQAGVTGAEEWFVENVFDELDAPNEFYFNQSSMQLFLDHNGTGPPNKPLLAHSLKMLVKVDGTRLEPVHGLTFRGLTFTATAPTYLDPTWDTPSGGDWALNWGGALHVEGSTGLVIEQSVFTRLDGNAVFLGKSNQKALLTENEFVWLGQNAMVLWGSTDGVDATAGDFPRGTNISLNICHEVGHYQKQVCMYV